MEVNNYENHCQITNWGKKLLISVIITVYNKEKYIKRCIESVLTQSYKDLEVIIINDGSTDDSGRIIEQYMSDPRVMYVYHENKGVAYCRNIGINLAKSSYIFFLDGDDFLCDGALEELAKSIELKPDVVVGNFLYRYGGKIIKNHPLKEGLYSENDLKNTQFKYDMFVSSGRPLASVCNKLYRKEFIVEHQVRFESDVISEDRLFNLYLFAHVPVIRVVNKYTYVVEVNDNSRSRSRLDNPYDQIIALFNKCHDFYKHTGQFKDNYDLLFFTSLNDIEKIHSHIMNFSDKKLSEWIYYNKKLCHNSKIVSVLELGKKGDYLSKINKDRKKLFLKIYVRVITKPVLSFSYFYLYHWIMKVRKRFIVNKSPVVTQNHTTIT